MKYSNFTTCLPRIYRKKTLDDYDWVDNPKLKELISNFCLNNSYPKKGLWLYGMVGVGKTFLLSIVFRIIKEATLEEVLFIEFQELLASLRQLITESIKFEELLDYYSTIPYLLIDDIFNEYSTESDNKIFSRLINNRYNRGYSIIATSNVDKKNLIEAAKDSFHLISRLVGMCDFIEVKGDDRRIR